MLICFVQNFKTIVETDVMDEQDFARFELKMSFGRTTYITSADYFAI